MDSEVQVIAFVGVEWGDLCCGAWGVVVCELAEWEEPVPVVLLVVTVDLDVLFQGLITAVCIIQGMRLFILKKNKCLVNSISPSILHRMI